MPLVIDKGIYCFYSKPLIAGLSKLIGQKSCLEIGAGDGTLSGFLQDAGVNITATDDYSWSHQVQYNENVDKLNAKKSLSKYQPQAVICSWPPAGNKFEAQVFKTKSVDLYIVLGSRHKFATGNWKSYDQQSSFSLDFNQEISRYILPPEIDPQVVIFRRNA